MRCDLQIFSGCVCHLEQLHAQSPFLFPIVFSINDTYRWRHETGNFRDRGPRIGEKIKGGWASWTAQAPFAWTRTHDEPRKSGTCGYIAAGLLRADVSSAAGTARLHGSGLLAPRHCMATVACSMPASVYLRVTRKRKFSTLSLRSAVKNGSFSLIIFCVTPNFLWGIQSGVTIRGCVLEIDSLQIGVSHF